MHQKQNHQAYRIMNSYNLYSCKLFHTPYDTNCLQNMIYISIGSVWRRFSCFNIVAIIFFFTVLAFLLLHVFVKDVLKDYLCRKSYVKANTTSERILEQKSKNVLIFVKEIEKDTKRSSSTQPIASSNQGKLAFIIFHSVVLTKMLHLFTQICYKTQDNFW